MHHPSQNVLLLHHHHGLLFRRALNLEEVFSQRLIPVQPLLLPQHGAPVIVALELIRRCIGYGKLAPVLDEGLELGGLFLEFEVKEREEHQFRIC